MDLKSMPNDMYDEVSRILTPHAIHFRPVSSFPVQTDHAPMTTSRRRAKSSPETIEKSIDGGEAYRIMQDGQPVGDVVIRVDGARGDLDLLFVSPKAHSRGIGYAAWCAVKQLHPEVTIWETYGQPDTPSG